MSDSAPSIALPIKAQYLWSADEVTRGLKAHLRYNSGPLKFVRYLGGIMIFCALFAMIWNKDTFLSIFPALLLGIFFLVINQITCWQVRRKFQKNPNKDSQILWSFSPENLHSEGDGFNFEMAWRKVFQFVDTPSGFLIYPQKQIYHWVPFTGFKNDSEIDCVRQIAKSQAISYKKAN
jgi:hypothetical protein